MEEYYHVIGIKFGTPVTKSPIVFPKEVAKKRAKEWQDFTHWPHEVVQAKEDYPEKLRWIPDMQTWPTNQTKNLIDSNILHSYMYNL